MKNILFFHPGGAPEEIQGRRPWRKNVDAHERAFLRARGRAVSSAAQGAQVHDGPLTFWGEWEADAWGYALAPGGEPGLPTFVFEPRKPSRPANLGLMHNTDPFVFDGPFLYSNCRQASLPLLRSLDRGDVLFFGSQLGGQFVLDTVFVVRERYPYRPARWRQARLPPLPESFVAATLGPLGVRIRDPNVDLPPDTELVLYVGATPDDPVDGMFSFVPALAAQPTAKAFRRPTLCEKKGRSIDSTTNVTWVDAVRVVTSAGLLLATSLKTDNGADEQGGS